MDECVKVISNGEGHDVPGYAIREPWHAVVARAEIVTFLRPLAGWGTYTESFSVTASGEEAVYFVARS